MISYNNKEWFSVFRVTKGDTFRKLLPLIVFVCIYTFIITLIEVEWLKLSDKSLIKNIPVMHTLLGFAISMLLVFRTNTAYDRWWEGRKLWGALVNNSRNLALKLHSYLPAECAEDAAFFRAIIPTFAVELKKHLQAEIVRLEMDERPHPELPDFDKNKHLPAQVAHHILQRVEALYRSQKITGDHLITLNNEIQSFMDICGACERIKNTPIPFSYSAFIKKFIFIYVITLPLGFVFSLGYLAIPVVAFIFYVLASLELIAEEIEDTFGIDENDLPMQRIITTIKRNVEEIFA